jgi:hypothetical protein
MDTAMIAALVTQVMTILTPFVGKVEEAIASKTGEAIFDRGKRIYEAIHTRFSKEADGGKANKVLENFADDPEEYKVNLQNKLLTLIKSDQNFADTLYQIIHSSPGPTQHIEVGDSSIVEGNQMIISAREGLQTMRGGNDTTLRDNTFEIS